MKSVFVAAAFAGASLLAFSASAVPIGVAQVTLIDTSKQNAANDANVYAAGFAANTPIGAIWSPLDPTITPPPNTLPLVYKSPFENATITRDGDNGPTYFSVGGSIAGGEGSTSPTTLTLAEERRSLAILWGSIDSYNTLEFLDSSNTLIQAITGTNVVNAFALSGLAPNFNDVALLHITLPTTFKSLRFLSEGETGQDIAAFEFALAPIPLPAAAWMLLTALAGLGFVARRKRAVA